MWLISADSIDRWSAAGVSKPEISRLVRRLIKATCQDWTHVDMVDGSQIYWHGFDGIVDSQGYKSFVPSGHSVWELSTEEGVKGKADTVYNGRSADPLGEERGSTYYVFATSRKWAGRKDWEMSKNSTTQWRLVSALDATSLQNWLEDAPGVAAEFAQRHLAVDLAGLQSGEGIWSRYSTGAYLPSGKAIGPEFVTANRTREANSIVRWLTKASESSIGDVLLLVGSSIIEMVHFICAGIELAEVDVAVRDRIRSSIVWLRSDKAMAHLETVAPAHIVLAAAPMSHGIKGLVSRRKCRAILMQESDREPNMNVWEEKRDFPRLVYLPQVGQAQRVAELCRLGMSLDGASEVCRNLGIDYADFCNQAHRYGLFGLGEASP